ncbi:Hypothetical protein PHPALM_5967 [Phytophthora palmivora]|uniref:Uncharacterized protein n=1 Tax=Phytophthora palmivora TaxID=4796 RepID=A0A2P4YG21_9STRA|nr:Hypothetical protein PHPALM_5967 [Phytophthora palmivora]
MGVGRKNIYSEPRPLKVRKTDQVKVQKVRPPVQAKARKEIPVDAAALHRLKISDGQDAKENSDEPATSGQSDQSMTSAGDTPASPVVSSAGSDSAEEDMDDFDGHKVKPVNSATVTAAAEELEEKSQAFEEKDADTA